MKLNKDQKGEDAEYILSYLPRIRQKDLDPGAVYKHYAAHSIQSLTLGYNFLRNENLKYYNNDESSRSQQDARPQFHRTEGVAEGGEPQQR